MAHVIRKAYDEHRKLTAAEKLKLGQERDRLARLHAKLNVQIARYASPTALSKFVEDMYKKRKDVRKRIAIIDAALKR